MTQETSKPSPKETPLSTQIAHSSSLTSSSLLDHPSNSDIHSSSNGRTSRITLDTADASTSFLPADSPTKILDPSFWAHVGRVVKPNSWKEGAGSLAIFVVNHGLAIGSAVPYYQPGVNLVMRLGDADGYEYGGMAVGFTSSGVNELIASEAYGKLTSGISTMNRTGLLKLTAEGIAGLLSGFAFLALVATDKGEWEIVGIVAGLTNGLMNAYGIKLAVDALILNRRLSNDKSKQIKQLTRQLDTLVKYLAGHRGHALETSALLSELKDPGKQPEEKITAIKDSFIRLIPNSEQEESDISPCWYWALGSFTCVALSSYYGVTYLAMQQVINPPFWQVVATVIPSVPLTLFVFDCGGKVGEKAISFMYAKQSSVLTQFYPKAVKTGLVLGTIAAAASVSTVTQKTLELTVDEGLLPNDWQVPVNIILNAPFYVGGALLFNIWGLLGKGKALLTGIATQSSDKHKREILELQEAGDRFLDQLREEPSRRRRSACWQRFTSHLPSCPRLFSSGYHEVGSVDANDMRSHGDRLVELRDPSGDAGSDTDSDAGETRRCCF
ncbi:MAG: hypothetical protein V3V61_06060 [Gammaproteobacteria bacterium]